MHADNYSIDVEQQIIGGLLKFATHSNSREALDVLDATDFYSNAHKIIYKTIKQMAEQKKAIDLSTVEDEMEKCSFDYGGFIYLAEMMQANLSISNMAAYVNVVKKHARVRDLSLLLNKTNDMINQKVDLAEILETLSNEIKSISVNDNGKDLQHISAMTGDWLDVLDKRAAAKGGILGVSTGIYELDERLNGIDPESLVVIAGRPSMGKTLFCQCIAQNIGIAQGHNIMFFSMEMSGVQLYERFISGEANVSAQDLRRANLHTENLGRVHGAATRLDRSGIYFTEEPCQTVGQIKAKVRNHKNKHPDLKMIFIDYLGLMKLGKADRHDIAVGDVTRSLKEMAKELKVPVVLVAQANRDLDKAKRPSMSNIKDSSAIEADADVIMFVHRQEVLEPETALKGITELIIAKDRHNDGNGTVYLQKVNGTFASISDEEVGKLQMLEEDRLSPKTTTKAFETNKYKRG